MTGNPGQGHPATAVLDSPLGPLVAVATSIGLSGLAFSEGDDPGPTGHYDLDDLDLAALAVLVEASRQLDEYWCGTRQSFDLPLDWGTTVGFAREVLEASRAIPFGAVTTYRDLAARAGRPRAYRAAGNALASNRIVVVVPCHRVLRSDGGIGGYGGRIDRKEHLLALESRALKSGQDVPPESPVPPPIPPPIPFDQASHIAR